MLDWFYDKLVVKQEIHAMLYGKPQSGKSTVLHKMNHTALPQRGIGWNIQLVQFYLHRNKFYVWDVGYNERYQRLFQTHAGRCRYLIYVVDSAQKQVLEQDCQQDLWNLLHKELFSDCILLVIATKQDLPSAVPLPHIQQVLNLDKFERPWKLVPATLNDTATLIEAFDWLAELTK